MHDVKKHLSLMGAKPLFGFSANECRAEICRIETLKHIIISVMSIALVMIHLLDFYDW